MVEVKPAGSFQEVGNFVAQGANHVNPELLDILQTAAQKVGLQVQAYSGYRPGDPRMHGKGLATDVRIIGPDGNPLPNYQTPETFSTYEKLAQAARQVQEQKYPDLSKQFRWGGYFSGDKGKYGAMDLMHFDLGGSDKLGMAGGSWDKGLTPQQAANFPGVKSVGALAYAPDDSENGNPSSSADATNAMAAGTLGGVAPHQVQTAGYVPPPFSTQQPNFVPLIDSGEQQQPKQDQNAVQQAPLPASKQQGDDDLLKAWGLGDAGNAQTAPQQPSAQQTNPVASDGAANDDDAVIKAWGLDKDAGPAQATASNTDAQPPADDLSGTHRTAIAATSGFLNGVPIIGPALQAIPEYTAAGVNSLINGAPFADNLARAKGDVQSSQDQHPYVTTGANIAGGVAGTLPLVVAAPTLMGAGPGGLAGNMLLGGASGAVLGGADSAVRSGGDLDATKNGAIIGAAGGAAGPAIGRGLGLVGNKLLNAASGTTPVARNVANVLEKIGMTPQDAKAALAKMGPDATLADIDPALTTEAGTLAAQGGAPTSILKTAMAKRAAGADDRVSQAVETTLGARPDLTQTQEAIAAKASADASPHYQNAPTDPLDASSVVRSINDKLIDANGSEKAILTKIKGYFTDPAAGDLSGQTQKAAGNGLNPITSYMAQAGTVDPTLDTARQVLVGAQNGTIPRGDALNTLSGLKSADPQAQQLISDAVDNLTKVTSLKTDPQALLKVRQAIDDDLQNAPKSDTTGGKNAIRAASDVRNQIDQVLKANPGIKAGDQAYSTQMQNLNAVEEGQEIFSPKTRVEDMQRSVAAKTPEQTQNMRTGALSALWDALDNSRNGDLTAIKSLLGKSTANRQKLETLFPNSSDIFDKISNEAAMRGTEQRVAQNSTTAERQAVGAKYAPKQNNVSGIAETVAGEALGGGAGALAGLLGRNALNSVKNQFSESARNALTEGTARGISSTGLEQQAFLNQLQRASSTSKGSAAITKGADLGTNLLFRSAADEYRNRLLTRQR